MEVNCLKCGARLSAEAAFCGNCGASVSGTSRGAPPTTNSSSRKSPATAGCLSWFLPGLGQFYNGDHRKGWTMLTLALLLFALTLIAGFPGLLFPVLGIWSISDAYRVAAGKSAPWR